MNKQLLLAQCAAALTTLRVGGHFVCKAFDLFTPFSGTALGLEPRTGTHAILPCSPISSRSPVPRSRPAVRNRATLPGTYGFLTTYMHTAGLLYLMHTAFERICIYKPAQSRPANSERYLVCTRLAP